VQPGQIKLWQQFQWVLWYDLLKLVVTSSMSRTGQLYWTAFGNSYILVEYAIFKEAQMLYVALGVPLFLVD